MSLGYIHCFVFVTLFDNLLKSVYNMDCASFEHPVMDRSLASGRCYLLGKQEVHVALTFSAAMPIPKTRALKSFERLLFVLARALCASSWRISDGLYFYQGNDEPDVSDGKPSYNIVADNLINSALEGIKMADTVGNEFTGNVSSTHIVDCASIKCKVSVSTIELPTGRMAVELDVFGRTNCSPTGAVHYPSM